MGQSVVNKETVLKELEILKPLFEERYGVTRIGIFGSLARGELRDDSDIDIVIEMKNPDMFYMVHIKEVLEDDFNRAVDVIHYREGMNNFLKKRIQKEAVYV